MKKLMILSLLALFCCLGANAKENVCQIEQTTFDQISDNIEHFQMKEAQFLFARTQESIVFNVPAPCDNMGSCQYDSQVTWHGCIYDIYICFNELGYWYCSRLFGC